MTEKELGRALLDLDAGTGPTAPDPRQMTRRILDRDRRRIRLLSGLAVLSWTLTAAGVVCCVPFYTMIVAPRLRAYGTGPAQLSNDWDAWARVGEWATYWVLACISALMLAAVSTVLLVLATRRATLRQINASLLAISEQLKRWPGSPSAEPGNAAG
jgi:hypothetical protein